MMVRRMLSVFVISALVISAVTPALLAAEQHVAMPAQLHKAVQNSNMQMVAARECIQNYIARPEVTAQLQRYGVRLSDVNTRVATLSEPELLFLQRQIMREDMATATVGGLTKAGKILTFIGIPVAVAGAIMLAKGNDEDDYGSDVSIDWRATGAVWLGAGAVLTIIGLTRRAD